MFDRNSQSVKASFSRLAFGPRFQRRKFLNQHPNFPFRSFIRLRRGPCIFINNTVSTKNRRFIQSMFDSSEKRGLRTRLGCGLENPGDRFGSLIFLYESTEVCPEINHESALRSAQSMRLGFTRELLKTVRPSKNSSNGA